MTPASPIFPSYKTEMRSILLLILSAAFLDCAAAADIDQIIDIGTHLEASSLKVTGIVTNTLCDGFAIDRIDKSCNCIGNVKIPNTLLHPLPLNAPFDVEVDLNTTGDSGEQNLVAL